MDRPRLYLSNWSGKARGHHGHGHLYTMMARPRSWERGEGTVQALVPPEVALGLFARVIDQRREGGVDPALLAEYRAACEARWSRGDVALLPGFLLATSTMDGDRVLRDGDTVACACSQADAALGRCHRQWAAPFLQCSGWDVSLDGLLLAAPLFTLASHGGAR